MTCFRLSAQVPEVLLCSAEHLISHLHLLTVSGATYDSSSVVFINVLSFCGWCISTSAVPFFFLVPAMATDTARLSGHLLLVVCYLKWKNERSHGSRSLQLACTHVTKEQFSTETTLSDFLEGCWILLCFLWPQGCWFPISPIFF